MTEQEFNSTGDENGISMSQKMIKVVSVQNIEKPQNSNNINRTMPMSPESSQDLKDRWTDAPDQIHLDETGQNSIGSGLTF